MNKLAINQKTLFKLITYAILLFFGLYYLPNIKEMFFKILGILNPFIIGAILGYILNIPMNFFEGKLKKRFGNEKNAKMISGISLILSWIVIIVVSIVMLKILVPRIILIISSTFNKWPIFVDEFYNFLASHEATEDLADNFYKFVNSFSWFEFRNNILSFLQGNSSSVLSFTTDFINSIGSRLISLFTIFFFSVFILVYKKMLKHNFTKILYAIFDEPRADYINKVFSLSYNTFKEYIFSRLIAVCTLSLLTFVGMVILRIPNAGMISIIIGISDLIPIFGPIFGAGFSSIIIFLESPVQAIIFLIFDIVIQQIQENVIYPAMAGEQIGLPAIRVLASVSIGGSLFGIWGMLISIPVFSIFYTLFHDFIDKKLERKNIYEAYIDEKKKIQYELGDVENNEAK